MSDHQTAEISISRTTHQLLWTQVSNIQVDEPREEQNQVCCYKQNLKPIHCLTPDEENSMSFFDPAACFTDGPKGLPKSAQSVKYAVLSDADSTSIDYVNQVEKAKDPSPSGYANRKLDNVKQHLKVTHKRALHPHSTPKTLNWLELNYETAEGVCIPRSTLYMHYVDFCTLNSIQPVNAASFGKIIRQQFPQLTTRRLGTRGQSRYHYYGIGIRESSPYFQVAYSKKAIDMNIELDKKDPQASGSAKNQTPGHAYTSRSSSQMYAQRSRNLNVLPEFPNLRDFILPQNLDPIKVETFIMMYRTHCQRILDTVSRANFQEVQTFLLHFWQGVPPHLTSVLSSNSFVNIIAVCDSILYKAIISVLLPSVLQILPDSTAKLILKFASELDYWLKISLYNLPPNLNMVKIELARRFGQILRRQTSLSHLLQASRLVVHKADIVNQMIMDWKQIHCQSIIRETLYTLEYTENYDITCYFITAACRDFVRLLEQESQIEAYMEWLDDLIQKSVVLPSIRKRIPMRNLARQFLFIWSAFCSRVIRDMTLQNALSFGSFHLLRLLFDDYVLYLIEYIHIEEQIKEFSMNISNDTAPNFMELYIPEGDIHESERSDGQNDQALSEYDPHANFNDANLSADLSFQESSCESDLYSIHPQEYYQHNSIQTPGISNENPLKIRNPWTSYSMKPNFDIEDNTLLGQHRLRIVGQDNDTLITNSVDHHPDPTAYVSPDSSSTYVQEDYKSYY